MIKRFLASIVHPKKKKNVTPEKKKHKSKNKDETNLHINSYKCSIDFILFKRQDCGIQKKCVQGQKCFPFQNCW